MTAHHLTIHYRVSEDAWRAECETCGWVGGLHATAAAAEREAGQHQRTAVACPACGHVGHPTVAVGRFHPSGRASGYRDARGDALRPTREAAEADVCARRTGGVA